MNPTTIDIPETATKPEVRGIVRFVDTFGREIGVDVEGLLLTLDVPVGCSIYLREERVKLRFLQAGDHVKVACSRSDDGLAAEQISVNWTSLVPHRGSEQTAE